MNTIITYIHMLFNLTKEPINYTYFISNSNIKLQSILKKFGLIFDLKLNFSLQTGMIRNIATLGLTKRTFDSFTDPSSLITIYCLLVSSNLKYYSLI